LTDLVLRIEAGDGEGSGLTVFVAPDHTVASAIDAKGADGRALLGLEGLDLLGP